MKLLIFGATGTIGHELVKQALEQGHKVSAFTRTAANVALKHPKLRVIEGDVLDQAAVKQAVTGHEAVLCTLGAGRKGIVRATGTKYIVHAMQQTGVERLICQTTLGIGDSQANLNFFWKYIMFGMLLRPAYKDHVEQEDYVKQSTLKWTIVRPGAFTNGVRTGAYKHGFAATTKTALKISRADVADFMLKQLSNERYLHQTPGLSY